MLKFWARASGSGKPSFGLSAKVTQNAPSGWDAQAPGGPGRRAHRDWRALNGPGAYRLPRLGPAAAQSATACKFHWCFWSMGRRLASFYGAGPRIGALRPPTRPCRHPLPRPPLLGGFFRCPSHFWAGLFDAILGRVMPHYSAQRQLFCGQLCLGLFFST